MGYTWLGVWVLHFSAFHSTCDATYDYRLTLYNYYALKFPFLNALEKPNKIIIVMTDF